ncbi:MAG: hypothetical protein GDA53_06425 [Rhodobacteraceae bacterium]|nr:hypothetical protein [Paracoccaceae bacterium]
MRYAKTFGKDLEGDLMLNLVDFLVDIGLSDSMDLAIEQANALNSAAKGIMLNTRTSQEFGNEMNRVVQILFRN